MSIYAPLSSKTSLLLFTFLLLSTLALLSACGSSGNGYNTTTGSGGTTTTPTSSGNDSNGPTGRYGGGYGNGSGTTPTPTATTPVSGPTQTVTITSNGNFAFSPTTLTIPSGTIVIWKNTTGAPHTVTSDDGGKSFDTGTTNPVSAQGGTFSFKFTKAGTYHYHCQFHPSMMGVIIVK